MNELDRRVAVEIMGEPQPPKPDAETEARLTNDWPRALSPLRSGLWRYDWNPVGGYWSWEAPHFSSSLEYAMKALQHLLREQDSEGALLRTEYEPLKEEPVWFAAMNWRYSPLFGYGTTLPEAICNLLLALKEKP